MTNEQKLILAIVILVILVVILVVMTIVFKKLDKYSKNVLNQLEEKTYEYYAKLELKDGLYFPYYEKHASGIRIDIKSNGDIDSVTNIEVKKHRKYYFDRVMYIVNNTMHYNFDFVVIDNCKYFKITKDIKSIELFLSFEVPSHFIVKYAVKSDGSGKYLLEIIKEDQPND